MRSNEMSEDAQMINFYNYLILDHPYKAKTIPPFVETIELVIQPLSSEKIMATTAAISFTSAALLRILHCLSPINILPRSGKWGNLYIRLGHCVKVSSRVFPLFRISELTWLLHVGLGAADLFWELRGSSLPTFTPFESS